MPIEPPILQILRKHYPECLTARRLADELMALGYGPVPFVVGDHYMGRKLSVEHEIDDFVEAITEVLTELAAAPLPIVVGETVPHDADHRGAAAPVCWKLADRPA